jgi:meso-butanediol dehydrogenase/(S,S)-butanediol dehydrogenase/diacetyl reductase
MPRLKDKIAIVTGGSRGIGRAIVDRFLAEGAQVMATARAAPDAPFREHASLAFAVADASSAAAAAAVVEQTVDRFGGLDVLVNNAAIQIEKTIEQTSEEEWDRILDVNLKGVFLHARAALAPMRRRGGGSIVNIGSYDGFVADPNLAAYCASKGGVHALTRAIAVDHGGDGIRCNAICPGWIATEMAEAYMESQPDPAAARRALASIHPVGRSGRPEDIAALAVWLASEESSFVTGQMFVADGGLTARAPQPR